VPELSDLQQEYMQKATVRQLEGIVKPQVVAGRVFKGTSFISKPESIIFKVSFKTIILTSELGVTGFGITIFVNFLFD
jgi:hypothetical protein